MDLPERLGRNIAGYRRRTGMSQGELAALIGVNRVTVSNWERGEAIPLEPTLAALALVLAVDEDDLRYGDHPPPHGPPFVPNPRYRKRLPPNAYATVYGYIKQMELAGATVEQLDEAERVMIDGAYNKLNTRDVRDRTEEDMILDINAAWAFIRDVLRDDGMKLK